MTKMMIMILMNLKYTLKSPGNPGIHSEAFKYYISPLVGMGVRGLAKLADAAYAPIRGDGGSGRKSAYK